MSGASRVWVSAGNLWPPFSNQMVVEGRGTLDIERMKQAVETASEANPGARLVCRGSLGRSRWIDSGICPGVREVDGARWSGRGRQGAGFLLDPFDLHRGPTCEVLVVRGSPSRCVFKTHHAVMDGRGTQTWAEDIFRVLRGEAPVGSDYLAIEDDFLNVSARTEKALPGTYISPLDTPSGRSSGFVWRRLTLKGKFSLLLPKVMCLIAREAWKKRGGRVRIGVPVDLRSRLEEFRSTSNLTNAIFFEIEKDTTPESLSHDIKIRLEEKKDGVLTWEDRIVRYVPLRLLERVLKNESVVSARTGRHRYSAFVSNLGRIPVAPFSTNEFSAEAVFFIPPGNELAPFFMVLSGSPAGLEIMLTVPASYCDDENIDEIMERIASGLKE